MQSAARRPTEGRKSLWERPKSALPASPARMPEKRVSDPAVPREADNPVRISPVFPHQPVSKTPYNLYSCKDTFCRTRPSPYPLPVRINFGSTVFILKS